jgi:hypothetical protein
MELQNIMDDMVIHDSYPDVRLSLALLLGDFPSQWLKLLQ